jgi:hypothetical protein
MSQLALIEAIARRLSREGEGGRFGPGGRMRRTGEYDNVYANGNDDTLRALAISLPVGGLTLREALLDRYGAMA